MKEAKVKNKDDKGKLNIKVLPAYTVFETEHKKKESFFSLYKKCFAPQVDLRKVFHHILWLFKGIQVFALVGKSGTGKSFRAKLVAQKYNIDLIIDDGLLIKGQKIIAGKSAKKENSKIAAIRTALFLESEHLNDVLKTLEREKFKRALIIATSEKMANKISERLGFPLPKKVIKIEDIASADEIRKARKSREEEGKHIIPVPAVEVKSNYPNIFFQSVKLLLEKKIFKKRNQKIFEKSIVRPVFSDKGKIEISDRALSQMVYQCIKEYDEKLKVERLKVERHKYGYRLIVDLGVPYGIKIAGSMHELQEYIIDSLDRFAGINIEGVNITISSFRK